MNTPLRRKPRFLLLLLLSLLAAPAAGQERSLRQIELAYGISLEIPSHWTVLPSESRKSLEATRGAITERAGIEKPGGNKEKLLAANATPAPAGAMIRLNVTTPGPFTQADLAAVSPEGLAALRSELSGTFQKLEAAGGPKILEMQPTRIERINDHLTLVIPYLRAGPPGTPPWEVTQYKIPAAGRLIEITLSHRQPEAATWKPVLEQVKRSLRF